MTPTARPPPHAPRPMTPSRTMRVLGVDPGSRTTGWGVVERDQGRYRLIAAGAIRTGTDATTAERLGTIFTGLGEIIAAWQPDCASIEMIFAHRSATSAIVLGQARGVALLALGQANLMVHEYNASTIKKSVSGSGSADKEQVARMVQALLGAPVKGPADITDAIAIAITHHANASRRALEASLAVRP